ncbi:hypothetical protein [Streptomyces sp. NPDC005435]|uniref:hypothetical protein n=1 Tax=Streptomyces sp. NPDC005435 TaxID=3154464 RepID=UPI0034551025
MRTPNYALALALAEAGWSNSETARRINTLAVKRGHPGVAVGRSRVSRWIRHGEKPRPPVPELVADLLTEQLHRRYTPDALGIGPAQNLLITLDPREHHALAARAAAANMTIEHYARTLLQLALGQLRRPLTTSDEALPQQRCTPM